MEEALRYHLNPARLRPGEGARLDVLDATEAGRARRFHAGFSQYAPTPLVSLPHLAASLGVGIIRVKDESKRFGSTPSRCSAHPTRWAVIWRNASAGPSTR